MPWQQQLAQLKRGHIAEVVKVTNFTQLTHFDFTQLPCSTIEPSTTCSIFTWTLSRHSLTLTLAHTSSGGPFLQWGWATLSFRSCRHCCSRSSSGGSFWSTCPMSPRRCSRSCKRAPKKSPIPPTSNLLTSAVLGQLLGGHMSPSAWATRWLRAGLSPAAIAAAPLLDLYHTSFLKGDVFARMLGYLCPPAAPAGV